MINILLKHNELDRNILFKVETSELRVLLHDNYVGDTTSKTCFIELLELTKVLKVANHHYSKCQNKLRICKSKMLHLLLPNAISKKSIG